MRFKFPNSKREAWIKIDPYLVDWEKKARSKLQTKVKEFLRPFLERHIVAEEFRIPRTRLRVDLIDFTSKVAYEVNGRQHGNYVPFFHQNVSNYFRQMGRDATKQTILEFNGYKFVEIDETDVENLSKEFFKSKFGLLL